MGASSSPDCAGPSRRSAPWARALASSCDRVKSSRPWGAPTTVLSYGSWWYLLMECGWVARDSSAMTAKIAYGNGHAALRRSRASIAQQIYHVTVTTKDREPVFLDFDVACAAARCHQDQHCLKGTTMLAWVLMPDHAHWLLQLGEHDSLPAAVTRLKCATARNANRALGRQGQLWGKAFHDHALRDERDLLAIARYIVANPLRAGLVTRIGAYPFWNAVWL